MKNFLVFFLIVGILSAQENIPYKNKNLSVEQRVEDLLNRMTLDEKIDMLGGTGFATKKIERLGIPELRMTDGPLGVRWGSSTAFPASIADAATWDPEIVNRVGHAIGRETKGHGRHVILGPCVNIARLPMGGRNFESYGEDPYLASKMTVSYIEGVQSENVAATVKHFAVNNQEYERMFVDAMVSRRALNEIYLPAFKAAVTEADVLCVMCSYNKVNLHWASENDYLLINKLKKEWGFKNLVMSDWGAVHSTIPVAQGGLDLEMPTGRYLNKSALENAVEDGTVPIEAINDKVRRILTVIFKLGLFDNPEWKENDSLINSPENRKTAYDASLASIVLLKNNTNLLPLNKEIVKTIAVIGPNADIARTGGGGSSLVKPINPVSPLDGLKNKLPNNIKVEFAKGVDLGDEIEPIKSDYLYTDKSATENGLIAEYYDNQKLSGTPKIKRVDKEVNNNYGGGGPGSGVEDDDFSIRWTGYVKSPYTGTVIMNTVGDDGIRLWIDDKLIIDDWSRHGAQKKSASVEMEKGKLYKIRMEYFENTGDAVVILGWKYGEDNLLNKAIDIAKNSDCVLLFVGISSDYETEGIDRQDLILPAGQDELINKVAEVNKNVVVVLNTGSPVLMNKWLSNVKSVVEMWYGGSEGGNAIADVLLGNYNPSGKLPVTFPKRWEDCSAYPTYKKLEAREYYSDDIYVGYRHFDKFNIEPLFPFGYGLSYTSFEYSNLHTTKSGNEIEVTFDIKNTGGVEGEEAAQLYVSSKDSEVDHPVKELKGFKKVDLKPGETKTVKLILVKNDLLYYDVQNQKWQEYEGNYEILIGASSRDIRLKSEMPVD